MASVTDMKDGYRHLIGMSLMEKQTLGRPYEIKKEYVEEILKSYADIGADDMGYGMSINSKDCRLVVLTDNNDILKSYQIVNGIDYIIDGETMSMEYDYTYTVVSINTITGIAFPDDLDSYIEFNY